MKKNYFSLCLMLLLGISAAVHAQSDPGTLNLKHQWTFDDGTAKDVVGTAHGVLEGAATVANKALNTTAGGFLSLPAADIAISGYPAITKEVWFTSASGVNTGFTMLSFFGETSGTIGVNYVTISAARGDNVSRATISTGNTTEPWAAETGVNGPEYDDGKLHHMVAVYTATNITFYIDGQFIGSAEYTGANAISGISNSLAYLCKAGYTSDPTWRGNIHKFSLFDKALTGDEVLFLYQKGAEEQPVLTTTVSALAFDDNYPAEMFNLSSANLMAPITVTAPAGISVYPGTIAINQNDIEITAIWNGTTPVDGNITLTSGETEVVIPVKTASDAACFVPLYTDIINIVDDPGINSLASFGGWGSKSIHTIINDPSNVYCGAATASVGNGTSTGSGSLDVALTGKIEPNTSYKVKAMIKTIDGTFQLGIWGHTSGAGDINNVIDTQGEWQELVVTFTTGAVLGGTQGMFFNNWSCTGTLAFIDNWEMYATPDPIIAASAKSFAFDPEYTTSSFNVTASNISEEIAILAPTGITVTPANFMIGQGESTNVVVQWDGTTAVDGNISLASSGISVLLPVKTVAASNNTCYTPLYSEKTNLIPDPFMNSLSGFAGWGAKGLASIVEYPDTVYCGSHSGLISGNGSIDVVLTGLVQPNTTYISKAMVLTVGGHFQMGVYGIDLYTSDITDSIDTNGTWQEFSLEFTTSEEMKDAQGIFFNKYQRTGKRAFIDNWQLYEKEEGNSVARVNDKFKNIFVQNGKIVVDFDLDFAANVEFSVYNMQGAQLWKQQASGESGRNRQLLETALPSGVYVVQMTAGGKSEYMKLVK